MSRTEELVHRVRREPHNVLLWLVLCTASLGAQVAPSSPLASRRATPPVVSLPKLAAEIAQPPAQTVADHATRLSFDLPAGWNLARHDGEVSTFHLDARSAPRKAQLRAVASLASNPYPLSTFSGALLYVSQTAHSATAACAAQTSVQPEKPLGSATIADLKFNRGIDEHGHICTEAHDVTYTAIHRGSCLRFDLVVNNFCGGEVSGARDLSVDELANILQRMEAVLSTARFTTK